MTSGTSTRILEPNPVMIYAGRDSAIDSSDPCLRYLPWPELVKFLHNTGQSCVGCCYRFVAALEVLYMPENGNIPRCVDTWRSYCMWPGINSEVPYTCNRRYSQRREIAVMRRELLMNRPIYRGSCELPTVEAALIVTHAMGIY